MHRTDLAPSFDALASSSRKAYLMDAPRFDRWTRSLTDTTSRRSVLGLAGVALGLAATRFSGSATAKKKHKKAPKKLTRNSFGCVNVGKACRGNSANCCSGICEGKKPKKGKQDRSKCVAHNVLDCEAGADSCDADVIACGTNGYCLQTTGQASFCKTLTGGAFVDCQKDTDCEPDYGPGAACIACVGLTICAAPAV
jgi:hypothetical protein